MFNISTTATHIQRKRITPTELVQQALATIEKKNKKINALITVAAEEALQEANTLEQEMMAGNIRSPLHGIPIVVKDLIYTKNVRTTMGSKVYEHFVPEVDATVIKKLKAAGAIILGKANTHEFAYGPTGDRSFFGACLNPYNLKRMAGGSSSGSAAAIACNIVAAALGTDTSGSIRIPAAACGIVGMKATFGLVSKKKVFPLAYTLDHTGPMTKNVRDNAILLNILAGYDEHDPYSIQKKTEDYTRFIGQSLQGKTVGVAPFYFDRVEDEVRQAVIRCLDLLQEMQVTVREVDLSMLVEIAEAQTITLQAEAAAVHQHTIQFNRDVIDEEVVQRLLKSQQVKGYEYVTVQCKRKELTRQFNQMFEHVDILLGPTLPILPPVIGQRKVVLNGIEETIQAALLRLTAPTNFTGNPSLSIPCGKSENGLPIGVQLIAKHKEEALLYQFGFALEEALSFQ